jgi:hypothetical protein
MRPWESAVSPKQRKTVLFMFFMFAFAKRGKRRWEKYLSELDAKKAAESAPVEREAQALGVVPDDLTNEANSNRTPIKIAVENYLHGTTLRPASEHRDLPECV